MPERRPDIRARAAHSLHFGSLNWIGSRMEKYAPYAENSLCGWENDLSQVHELNYAAKNSCIETFSEHMSRALVFPKTSFHRGIIQ